MLIALLLPLCLALLIYAVALVRAAIARRTMPNA
jgi:hypothetical protein